ncbi:hypothetical protein V5799_010062 [Amblyomma americanum]|uniref:AMP-binding enzyme C-terminal domain-containing protein n=1 Tax=Amblyomma americanum TaxID=6943 RepID=A0AAQ4F9U1_AMBAM
MGTPSLRWKRSTRRALSLRSYVGDMGYYNEQGVFYITDRVKDLIKCMDQQVPPAELEGLLLQHEAVLDVAVVGVPHDDYGEAARAFVVLREGHEPSQALKDALFNLVAGMYLPMHIQLMDWLVGEIISS